mmetsp:Transcript_39048/g.87628  ORF Transcript_39048/g.87628 Transcript_39048/m.87628 type:complete len:481 (+) Transcript_39048:618-2060(+)
MHSVFLQGDGHASGVMTAASLSAAFESETFAISWSDVEAMIRRMDRTHDGLVTYLEFTEALLPAHVSTADIIARRPIHRDTAPEPYSPLAFGRSSLARESSAARLLRDDRDRLGSSRPRSVSPLRSRSGWDIPREDVRPYSPAPRATYDFGSPVATPSLRSRIEDEAGSGGYSTAAGNGGYSPAVRSLRFGVDSPRSSDRHSMWNDTPHKQPSWRGSVGGGSPKSPSRLDSSRPEALKISATPASASQNATKRIVLNALHDMLRAEAELEQTKSHMAVRSDVHLLDVFRSFDSSGHGYISPDQFEEGLRFYGLHPSPRSVRRLFRRYGDKHGEMTLLQPEPKLLFAHFVEMLTPVTPEYRNLMVNRLAGAAAMQPRQLSGEARHNLSRVFQKLLDGEAMAERVRSSLTAVSLREAFEVLSGKDSTVYATLRKDDLRTAFGSHASVHDVSDRDLRLLMRRFDRAMDDSITYRQWVAELSVT